MSIGGADTSPPEPEQPRRAVTRVGAAVVLACAGIAVAAGAAVIAARHDSGAGTSAREMREAQRGYVDDLGSPPVDGPGGVTSATPRPASLGPMVPAQGDCADLLHGLRDLMDRYSSGLDRRSAADEAVLAVALARLSDDATCPGPVSSAFRASELGPWLTWAPGPERSS